MKTIKQLIYLSSLCFLTLNFGCKKNDDNQGQPYVPPTSTEVYLTTEVTNITNNTVTLSCEITSDGGSNITARGFCYSVSPDPTTSDTTTSNGSGTGMFTAIIDNLTPNATYYGRSYAINSIGITYGNEVQFLIVAPLTLITTSVTNISYTTATVGGQIISDGGSAVTERGICYSENSNPTLSDSSALGGTGTGTFTVNLSNLSAGHTYHFRSYAKNLVGTYYGNDETFTTTASPFSIGQVYEGGVIFHIDASGLHGLISSTANQGTNITWGLSGVVGSVDDGLSNTIQIVTSVGPGNYAASICQSLSLGGYNDWYLPSIGELHLLFEQRNLVGGFNGPAFYFWSSTGYALNNMYANATGFMDGYTYQFPKTQMHAVRAIRRF